MSTIISYLITARNAAGPALQQVQGGLQNAGKAAGGLVQQLGGVKGAVAGLAGLAGTGMLVGLMKGTVESNLELWRLAKFLGMTVEELSRLRHAAVVGGMDMAAFGETMTELAKKQREALQGGDDLLFYFNQLGVSVEDLKTKNLSQLLDKMADGFNELKDSPQKASIALTLFEDKGQGLSQMLAGGSAGLQKMRLEADRLGATVSTKTAKEALLFTESLTKLKATVGPLVQEITSSLIPIITAVSDEMLKARKSGDGWGASLMHTATAMVAGGRGTIERLGNLESIQSALKDGTLDKNGMFSDFWDISKAFSDLNTTKEAMRVEALAKGVDFKQYVEEQIALAKQKVGSMLPPTATPAPPAATSMPALDKNGYPSIDTIPAGLPPLAGPGGRPMAAGPSGTGNLPALPPPGAIPPPPSGGAPASLPAGSPAGAPGAGTREAQLYDATDTLATRLAAESAVANNSLKIWQASYTLQKSLLASMLDEQKVSYRDYYAQLSAIEQEELQKQYDMTEAEIGRQQQMLADASTVGDRTAAETALNGLYAERATIVIKMTETQAASAAQEAASLRALAVQMSDIAAQAAELDQNARAAAEAKLEAQFGEIERLAKINGLNTEQIDKIKAITRATADLKDAQRELALELQYGSNAELGLDAKRARGSISQETADQRAEEIRREAARNALPAARSALDAARRTGSEEEVLNAERTLSDLESRVNAVKESTRQFLDDFEARAGDAGAAIFRGFQEGGKEGREAVKAEVKSFFQSMAEDAASSIAKSLAAALRETLMEALASAMMGSGGGGGIFSSIIGGIASFFGGGGMPDAAGFFGGGGSYGMRAAGGSATGLTLVGEQGPELVDFGQSGATVLNAARTSAALAGAAQSTGGGAPTVNVHFHGMKDGHEIKRSMSQIQAQVSSAVQAGYRNK